MVVLVEPVWEGVAPLGLAGVVPGVGPPVGQGAVESFDLAIGLRPVGPCVFRGDAQVVAGVAPEPGTVGRAVVRQDPGHGDPAIGEPRSRPREHSSRGSGGLVIVDGA